MLVWCSVFLSMSLTLDLYLSCSRLSTKGPGTWGFKSSNLVRYLVFTPLKVSKVFSSFLMPALRIGLAKDSRGFNSIPTPVTMGWPSSFSRASWCLLSLMMSLSSFFYASSLKRAAWRSFSCSKRASSAKRSLSSDWSRRRSYYKRYTLKFKYLPWIASRWGSCVRSCYLRWLLWDDAE